jgi:hypothetical protein
MELRPDLEVTEDELDRLNEPDMARQMLVAADRMFEQLMCEAERVGRLPLERIPSEPILLNLIAALAAQAAINLGGSAATQRGMLDTIGESANALLNRHIDTDEGRAGPTH